MENENNAHITSCKPMRKLKFLCLFLYQEQCERCMLATYIEKREQPCKAHALHFPLVRVLVLMTLWDSQGENGAWGGCLEVQGCAGFRKVNFQFLLVFCTM